MNAQQGSSPSSLQRVELTDFLLLVALLLLLMRLILPSLLGGVLDLEQAGGGQPGGPLGLVMVMALLVQSAALIGLIALLIVRRRGLAWRDLGLNAPPGQWIGRAVLYGFLCVPLAAATNILVQGLLGAPIENPQIEALAPTATSAFSAVLMIATASLIVPFCEELAFRGLLFRWLRGRMPLWPAAGLSAVCFAVLHGIPVLIPALTAIGIVLALATERSGSIWPSIVIHGTFNFLMAVTLFLALSQGGVPPGGA